MATRGSLRTVLAAVGALVCVGLAVAAAARFLGGARRPFEQRALSAEAVSAIEATTRELLALEPAARKARLRELMSPDAPPQAIDAVAAQLAAIARAPGWTLAAADGYGPALVKAIYDLPARRGPARQVAHIFERRDARFAPLDVAH